MGKGIWFAEDFRGRTHGLPRHRSNSGGNGPLTLFVMLTLVVVVLQSAGRDIPKCGRHQPVIECTSNDVLQDVAFNTYTEFFTHTQSICFHLQNQVSSSANFIFSCAYNHIIHNIHHT